MVMASNLTRVSCYRYCSSEIIQGGSQIVLWYTHNNEKKNMIWFVSASYIVQRESWCMYVYEVHEAERINHDAQITYILFITKQ